MYQLDAGEVLQLPFTILEFDQRLDDAEFKESAFDAGLYNQWKRTNTSRRLLTRRQQDLGPLQCVGFMQPLFLGGDIDVQNMKLQDLDVHLTLTAQIWVQVRDLPKGAQIEGVTALTGQS